MIILLALVVLSSLAFANNETAFPNPLELDPNHREQEVDSVQIDSLESSSTETRSISDSLQLYYAGVETPPSPPMSEQAEQDETNSSCCTGCCRVLFGR